jgi:hypothetical protein
MVIGRVGFSNNGEFVAHPHDASDLIAELEAEIAKLTTERDDLRRVLKKCAALTPQISDEKHEILLKTDPRNYENPQENP